jgi:hypothetical protein
MELGADFAVKGSVTSREPVSIVPGSSAGCPMGSVTEPNRNHDLASTMAERITGAGSDADALKALRKAYPETPLAVRVAALALLARRSGGDQPHIPR